MRNTFIISVVSTKGGVGKTTVAANTAALLADLGYNTLLVDADVQPSLTKYFLQTPPNLGMAEVLSSGGVIQSRHILPTPFERLSIIPSNLSDISQSWLKEREDRLVLLKRALRQPIVREQFDFVVIDTQGAKGELQRSSAMAADVMLSPLAPRMMELVEFQSGTLEMLSGLNSMADFSPELRAAPLCMVINGRDRTTASRQITAMVRDQFRSHPSIRVLDTIIPHAKAYSDARLQAVGAHRLDLPRTDRATPSAYQVMHELVHEICPWLKDLWLDGPPASSQVEADPQVQGGARE